MGAVHRSHEEDWIPGLVRAGMIELAAPRTDAAEAASKQLSPLAAREQQSAADDNCPTPAQTGTLTVSLSFTAISSGPIFASWVSLV